MRQTVDFSPVYFANGNGNGGISGGVGGYNTPSNHHLTTPNIHSHHLNHLSHQYHLHQSGPQASYQTYYTQTPPTQQPPPPPPLPPPTTTTYHHQTPSYQSDNSYLSHFNHHPGYTSQSNIENGVTNLTTNSNSIMTLSSNLNRNQHIEHDDESMSTGDIWRQVERRMYAALELKERSRRQCAYCGVSENDVNSTSNEDGGATVILGRCYGCQLTYYCSQEHQHLDWLQSHMPKCAELEWIALCELVQATQITLPLPGPHQTWPHLITQTITTWTDWFEMRTDLVKCAHLVGKTMEQNLWRSNSNAGCSRFKLNRREPAASELVDGLLAQVTDSMTYALTLGDAIKRCVIIIFTNI